MRSYCTILPIAVPLLACIGLALGGCMFGSVRETDSLPDRDTLERDQLMLHSDFPLPRHHRLVDELVAQRQDIADKLQLPVSDEPIQLYLFQDAERFRSYMQEHYPHLPERRAFFVESDTRLAVFAHWGDHVAEDLRHEMAHGYLHATVHGLPLWLDEGLAEYFEVDRGRHGVNEPHIDLLWDRLQQQQWQPDIGRLERLVRLEDMEQIDYAESWLWVHFALETTNLRLNLLQNYLARLRMKGEAPPLERYLFEAEPNCSQQLIAHLALLGKRLNEE